jgi:hypothetical protein
MTVSPRLLHKVGLQICGEGNKVIAYSVTDSRNFSLEWFKSMIKSVRKDKDSVVQGAAASPVTELVTKLERAASLVIAEEKSYADAPEEFKGLYSLVLLFLRQ